MDLRMEVALVVELQVGEKADRQATFYHPSLPSNPSWIVESDSELLELEQSTWNCEMKSLQEESKNDTMS